MEGSMVTPLTNTFGIGLVNFYLHSINTTRRQHANQVNRSTYASRRDLTYIPGLEARQAQVQAAADQKSALQLAGKALQVQKQAATDKKRALLLAENEHLKAQIIRELLFDKLRPHSNTITGLLHNIHGYLPGHSSDDQFEVITIELEAGCIVATAKVGSKQFLRHSVGPKEYSMENINKSLHALYEDTSEDVGKVLVAKHGQNFA